MKFWDTLKLYFTGLLLSSSISQIERRREDAEIRAGSLMSTGLFLTATLLTSDIRTKSKIESKTQYDFALSFAGEDRQYAEALSKYLKAQGKTVFYDKYEQHVLLGEDLYQRLHNVYKNESRFCVILVSTHYANKLWTRHELRAAQERAFKENYPYILPLKLDDTDIPGLSDTIGYIDLRNESLESAGEILIKKHDS